MKLWQRRSLNEVYPIVCLNALMARVEDAGHIQNQSYVVLGVNLDRQKGNAEVVSWRRPKEGGLKGFPEALEAVCPRTEVRLCIAHLVRASLNYVSWKVRKLGVAGRQSISLSWKRGVSF